MLILISGWKLLNEIFGLINYILLKAIKLLFNYIHFDSFC